MILRSVMKHVRDQNWTAVGLDFVIVVVGVFIGIQVANWNEAQADKGRSRQYLERIASDLSQDISVFSDRAHFWRQVSDHGLIVLDEAKAVDASRDSWDLLLSYFQASQVAEFFPTNATFEELKSAGELGLILDANLRSELAEYYAYPGIDGLRERPRYREHVRSILPARIQNYIWLNCYMTDGNSQFLQKCASPAEASEVRSIVEGLKSNETLHDELRYWVSSLEVALLIAQGYSQDSKELRDEVMTQLGHNEAAP